MQRTLFTLSMFAAAATMMGRPAAVTANSVPLVCQDRQLHAGIQLNQCWARCEGLPNVPAPRRHKPPDLVLADCRWACWDRYDGALGRIQRSPACAPPSAKDSKTAAPSCTPDRDMCAARLSLAKSSHMLCHSYCTVQAGSIVGFDVESCDTKCGTEYDKEQADLLGDCICPAGASAP